ncbi:MAG: hypothetical protein ABI840_11665 [bacterium]
MKQNISKITDSSDAIGKSIQSHNDNVRGKRYCEIFIVKREMIHFTATVYNTLGCNECPEDIWKTIDPEKLKKEFSAKYIIMNGPRYFMMDKIGQSNKEPGIVMIGGLEMKERATFSISFEKIMRGKSKPYEENVINRSTEFVFNKGKKIYELISPKYTYVMQSYSLIVDPNLTENDLDNLQTKLKLPKGWEYKIKILDNDLVLKTIEGGEAHVLQDDFENSYQRID